jgi:hypothetical protein
VPDIKRRRGPRTIDPTAKRVVSISLWPETVQALDAYAKQHNLFRSGAAHVLIRQALNLPPINSEN